MSKIKEFIKKNKIFSLLIVVAIAIISVGIFAPIIAPYSPFEGNLSDALQPPSSEHIFGTDKLGRDVFSRVVYGTRIGTCYFNFYNWYNFRNTFWILWRNCR